MGAMRVIFDVDNWGNRAVFFLLSNLKATSKKLQNQWEAQAIVIFSQLRTDGIREVITTQWKVKVKSIVQLLCNYWATIEDVIGRAISHHF